MHRITANQSVRPLLLKAICLSAAIAYCCGDLRAQDSTSETFSPPPSPRGAGPMISGAYGRVPSADEYGADWGTDVAPQLNQSPYGRAGYSRSSTLDPNLTGPGQSISEFADGHMAGPCGPCGDCVGCLPNGPLQTVRFQTTWLAGDDLGFTDFEVWSKWEFATISEYSKLQLMPVYGLHLVDGPDATDLPPQLHDLYLDIQWINPFSREWAVELGLTPGLYSDFQNDADDAFRLGARIVGYYTMSPVWRFALGVAYLDREDVQFFPLGGVIWTPDPDTRFELVLPRPKLAWRFNCCGGCEDWWYVAGEFGGGSWSIERASGLADQVNYYDWRFAIGWERRCKAGPTVLAEIGYVFNRRLEYDSGGAVFEPDDTIMLRGMIGF